jgi:hypothetical protein
MTSPIFGDSEPGGDELVQVIWANPNRVDDPDVRQLAVVQELGHVLNYVSVTEPLPTVFKPVSPPPYMNGDRRSFSPG